MQARLTVILTISACCTVVPVLHLWLCNVCCVLGETAGMQTASASCLLFSDTLSVTRPDAHSGQSDGRQ